MYGFHGRVVSDVPVDGYRVVASVRVRRLACPVLGRPRQAFGGQVPGLIERYQRRTRRLADQLGEIVEELLTLKSSCRGGRRLVIVAVRHHRI